jgi:LacI family transcriptional regulator
VPAARALKSGRRSTRRAPDATAARRITIREVALKAGVSLGTASRVVNGMSNVAPDLRKRVQGAIARLGYKPDMVAQSMRSGATRAVGILVRDIANSALAGFVRAAQEALHEAGYALVLACSEEERERELDFLNLIARRRVDGLIMTTASERDTRLLEARRSLDLPIVLFDREIPESMDAILIAHDQGVRQAIEYLHAMGHRRIALVTGSDAVYPGRARIRGYREAHKALGLSFDRSLLRTEGFSEDAAFMETSTLLSLPHPPTAIIAGGISMLPGALRAVRARGLRVPEDVSLIGSGDSDLAALATPSISVIRWSYSELGRTGARLLLDRLERIGRTGRPHAGEPLAPRRIVVPTEFVTRESCGPRPRHP